MTFVLSRSFALLIFRACICLLFGRVQAQQSASFQFPVEPLEGLTVNYIDTVVLQWTSNFANPLMYMWCQNGSGIIGNNVVLGSQFSVKNSGTLSYVIQRDFPDENSYPVACHAQLVPTANGPGIDSPAGITFTSQPNVLAKTISLSSSPAAAPVTNTPAVISSVAPTPKDSSQSTSKGTSVPNLAGVTTSGSLIISGTGSLRTTLGTVTSRTGLATGISAAGTGTNGDVTQSSNPAVVTLTNSTSAGGGAGATSSSNPGGDSKSGGSGSGNNNLGAIVGGVLGGAALICLVVFGILFLRKYNKREGGGIDRGKNGKGKRKTWWSMSGIERSDGYSVHEVDGVETAKHEKEGTLPHFEMRASLKRPPVELP